MPSNIFLQVGFKCSTFFCCKVIQQLQKHNGGWTCANGFVEQHHLCHISCQIVWCAMRSIGRHWPATDGFNGGTIKLLLRTLLHCLCLFCIDYTGREPQDIMRFHFWASVFSTEKLPRTVDWTSLGCRGLLQHLYT